MWQSYRVLAVIWEMPVSYTHLYDSAPYQDKFTLFMTREGFDESVKNSGFLPLGGRKVLVRLDGKVFEADLDAKNDLPADVEVFILTVPVSYTHLVMPFCAAHWTAS